MRRHMLLTICVCLGIVAIAQRPNGETPHRTEFFNVAAIKNLKVETRGGSIQVKGGEHSGRIEMYVIANNRGDKKTKSEMQQLLDAYYDIDIHTQGGALTAKARRKDIKWSNQTALSISFVVYSGSHLDAELYTSGGSLDVQGIDGVITGKTSGGSITAVSLSQSIDLTTSGGQIKADDLNGVIKLNTSGGSLNLSDLSGTINANTSGGSIMGHKINGDFSTETSGGSIHLKEIEGNLNARTSGGQIIADIKATREFVKLHTSAGNISLKMPKTTDAQLDLKGSSVHLSELRNFNGTVKKDRIKGSWGEGTLLVEAATSGGSVNVKM